MRTQTPIKHKTDLKELHILSFYFHAFDFIIGIECNFAESRDTLKRGQMAPLPRRSSIQPWVWNCRACL